MWRWEGKEDRFSKKIKMFRLTSTEGTAGRIHPPWFQNPTQVLGLVACSHQVLQFAILFIYGNSSGGLKTQPGCSVRSKRIPSVHALDPTVPLRPLKGCEWWTQERLMLASACPRWALAGEGTPAAALAPGRAAVDSVCSPRPSLQHLARADMLLSTPVTSAWLILVLKMDHGNTTPSPINTSWENKL